MTKNQKPPNDQVQLEQTTLDVSAPLMPTSPHVAAPGVEARGMPVVPRAVGEPVAVAQVVPAAAKSARELLATFDAQRAVIADEVLSDEKSYIHYVRCYRNHPEPAIYLIGHPGGRVLGNADWFSTYHEAGAPYHRHADLYCQHCAKFNDQGEYEGELFQVAGITYVPTRKHNEILFTIAPRWVMRYAGDPEQFKKDGGPHRATVMSQPLMNQGLPASVRRREVTRV